MSDIHLHWPVAPEAPVLHPGEVHVWAASLGQPPPVLERFALTLSAEEMERASGFRFGIHRRRYIAGRGLMRAVLGRYLGADPAALAFIRSPRGKPELAEAAAQSLRFNLAHSGDLALFAVTRLGPVGVDVEELRPVKSVEDLVARFFSERENEAFRKLAVADRPAAFLRLWTRKEALLKATGTGISGGLNRVEVTFLPGEPARLLALPDSSPAQAWSLHALAPAEGFVGALAIESPRSRLSSWSWA